jgi:hypothetical protein
MPLPEGYLPRKGDVLLIRVVVQSDYYDIGDGLVSAAVDSAEHRKLFVNMDKIHSLYRRKWNAGDKVTAGDFEGAGEVIGIDGDEVWVRDTLDLRWTIVANELEPWVDPEEQISPPPAPGSQSVVGDDEEITRS